MGKKQASRVSAFPPVALEYLRKAGWTPNRAVPTSTYERAYKAESIPLLPKPKKFLREFGGLIICYVTKLRQQDVLEFLAEQAVQGIGDGGIKGFEELIGVAPLCPIGHCFFGTCLLLMDANGRVFGGSDETVVLIGKTGKQAATNILTGVGGEAWFHQTSPMPCRDDQLRNADVAREKKQKLTTAVNRARRNGLRE
jgi:hypothetical protein